MSTSNHEGFPFQPGAAPEDVSDAEPETEEITEEQTEQPKRKPSKKVADKE